ncbi:hypothetical protein IT575_12845 [bacterium]|nr:hypothetical protein [bacterium]
MRVDRPLRVDQAGLAAGPWLLLPVLLLLGLLALGACSGCASYAQQHGSAQGASTPARAEQAAERLPAPSSLPAPDAVRSAAFADSDRFKDAAAFEAGLPSSAVSAEGGALRFSPDWDTATSGSGMQDVALAVYGWSLAGYDSLPSLGLQWDSAPDPALRVWLGLANFTADRWDWQLLPGSASTASLDPLAQHLRADGAVYAAVLLLGPASAPDPLLERIFIGSPQGLLPGDIKFTVDLSAEGQPISPLIYGVNGISADEAASARPSLMRFGGNRWTAYNWETNASNAGSDWFHQNDGYISESNLPGQAVRENVEAAFSAGAAALVTMPIQGYVAADKNGGGDVNQTPDYLNVRFRQNLPAKGSAFSLTPEPLDAFVYQDEFLNWLDTTFPGKLGGAEPQILVSLDNEPDLWHSTHVRIQPDPLSYDSLISKSIASMLAMRAVVPEVQFFGAVNYGWYGYETLQDAPDAGAHGQFLDYYLQQMAAAESTHGQRLLNVLDVHWYPEAQGNGVRITGDDTSAAVVEARLQAPRSLWDGSYTEDSWITQWSTGGPIYLLPRLQQKIAQHYPGTKLALTEYNYGAGGHISGGLAQADALGAFGREGVYAANIWPLSADNSYIHAALRLYRNHDGSGGSFGDLSLPVIWDDYAGYSAYGAAYSADSGALSLLLINKQNQARTALVELSGALSGFSAAQPYTLSSAGGAQVQPGSTISLPAGNSFNVELPAMSATLLVLE